MAETMILALEGLSRKEIAEGGAGDIVAEKYELQRPLARGGMGQVWVAQNQLTERRVAIKFMLPELATSPDTVQRFFREAKASARIDHPSIVDVLDLGTLEDGAPFMVMEFLEGKSLEEIIDREPLAPIQAAAILLDVAHALAAAHAAGIVHRDVKPDNILITRDGAVKITDLGMVKQDDEMSLTQTGHAVGTPWYMPLEQAKNAKDTDGRSDIYALGCSLYCMLTGRPPFLGRSVGIVIAKHLDEAPRPPRRSRFGDVFYTAEQTRALGFEACGRREDCWLGCRSSSSASRAAPRATAPVAWANFSNLSRTAL